MRKLELERLLEKTVADALGVALPDGPRARTPARLPRHALPKRARPGAASARHQHHHHRAAEHA